MTERISSHKCFPEGRLGSSLGREWGVEVRWCGHLYPRWLLDEVFFYRFNHEETPEMRQHMSEQPELRERKVWAPLFWMRPPTTQTWINCRKWISGWISFTIQEGCRLLRLDPHLMQTTSSQQSGMNGLKTGWTRTTICCSKVAFTHTTETKARTEFPSSNEDLPSILFLHKHHNMHGSNKWKIEKEKPPHVILIRFIFTLDKVPLIRKEREQSTRHT